MKIIQKPKRMWQKKKDYNKKKLIRKIQRRNKTSFDDGKDRSYQDWKTKISKYKHIDIDHDNTFDYEGFYNSDPDNAYRFLNDDPTAHFDDTYKTVYHPTFSDLSIYSGKADPRFNPEGLKGGRWVNDHKYLSPKQSPVSMDERIGYLGEAEDNGVQLRTPDDKPVWLDDGTRWDGVLPNVIIKPKRYKKGKDCFDIGTDNGQQIIYQDGDQYFAGPSESAATIKVTPYIQRLPDDKSTWDFIDKAGNKYTTEYTDDQLKELYSRSIPESEFYNWVDKSGKQHRQMKIIPVSPVDPVGEMVVEGAVGTPLFKGAGWAGKQFVNDVARDFGYTKFGNWLRNRILSNTLNKNVNSWDGTVGSEYFNSPYNTPKFDFRKVFHQPRMQFDEPTYQMYTGKQYKISDVINKDKSVNIDKLKEIYREALKRIPGGYTPQHRLENTKWHKTDWNTFLHSRDAYQRALQFDYPDEALFPTLMHDAGKLWTGDGHGPFGASIIKQMFPDATDEQIMAIYGHMTQEPYGMLGNLVKGADIRTPNKFRDEGLRQVKSKTTNE